MANYKTPGVYVEEISTLPPSVGQVPTAVPAFIGYSEKAVKNGKSIINVPTHLTSLLDYHIMFGAAADYGKISVSLNPDSSVGLIDFEKRYYLYDSVRMFFANGGGQCYIVSVGTYNDDVTMDKLMGGLASLEKEDHPTILLCADAMLLKKKDQAYTIQQAMLMQCNKLQDRVAVLDVYNGFIDRKDEDIILDFRNGIGVNHLKYGATYYPWIQTTLSNNFGFEHINLKDKDGKDVNIEDLVDDPSAIKNVKQAIEDLKIVSDYVVDPLANKKSLNDTFFKIDENLRGKREELVFYANTIKSLITSVFELKAKGLSNILIDNELAQKLTYSSALATVARALTAISNDAELKVIDPTKDFLEFDLAGVEAGNAYKGLKEADLVNKGKGALKSIFESMLDILISIRADTRSIKDNYDKAVYDTNILYKSIVNEVQKKAALLPPSGAMAGIYAQVDGNRGVWKAPANVSLSSVSSPWVKIDNDQQEDLNVDVNAGKSINAIRAFTGKGTLVWGARTLAGNDNEWRYISVRRFFNMVEKSVKLSTNWAVFEANDATTWIRVKAMIENYLTNLWQAGALAGATPDAAYFVNVGLGSTMSAIDILEGRMNVEIGMAAVRPAEFIILKFSHKLQES
jgi:phage tail sheath protein FI